MDKKINRITPVVEREIAAIARDLPPTASYHNGQPVYKKVKVRGDHPQLAHTALKEGTKLDKNAYYLINELQYENHHQNMCNLFKRDGMKGVTDYRDAIEAQFEQFKKNAIIANGKWYEKVALFFKQFITK